MLKISLINNINLFVESLVHQQIYSKDDPNTKPRVPTAVNPAELYKRHKMI